MNLKFFIYTAFSVISSSVAFSGDPMKEEYSAKRGAPTEEFTIGFQEKKYTLSFEELSKLEFMKIEYCSSNQSIMLRCNQEEEKAIFNLNENFSFSKLKDITINFDNFLAMESLKDLRIETPDFFITGLKNISPSLTSIDISCFGISSSFKNIKDVISSEAIKNEGTSTCLTIHLDEGKRRLKAEEIEDNIEKILREFPNNAEIQIFSESEKMPAIPLLYTLQNEEKIYFSHLKILDLSSNTLVSIEKLAFSNFENLEILSLDHNDIFSFKSFSKTCFPNLTTLDVSGNAASLIKPLSRMKAPKMKFLCGVTNDGDDDIVDPAYLAKFTKSSLLKTGEHNIFSADESDMEEEFAMEEESEYGYNIGMQIRRVLRKAGIIIRDII